MAASMACGGGGGESLLQPCPQSTNYSQPRAPRGCVCFVSFMDVCDFFFQATKGLEKGTGNCICGKIEQTGLSRSCMDRWIDGQMGEDARGSSMTPGGWQEVSAAEH